MKIALIAHDKKKDEIIQLAIKYKDILSSHDLYATGTTGTLIMGETALSINRMKSGPLGGDQQIGAKIADGGIDIVIFFSDPLTSQPHDPDVKALLRIAQVYDIPMAINSATAEYVIKSELFEKSYEREIRDYESMSKHRKIDLD